MRKNAEITGGGIKQRVGSWMTRPRVETGLGLLLLLAVQARFLIGSYQSFDLRLWDGSWYFEWGREIAQHFRFPAIENGPLYTGYYAVFHLLFDDVFTIYYMHRVLMLVLISVLLYFLLCNVASPLVASLLGAYFLLLIEDGGPAEYANRSFVLIPALAAMLFSFKKGIRWSFGVWGALIAAMLVRPEYALAMPLAVFGVLWQEWKSGTFSKWSTGKKRGLRWGAVLGIVLCMALPVSLSHRTARSWLAFGQHFSVGAVARHPKEVIGDPWLAWQTYLRNAFGDVHSIAEAAVSNPAVFAEHVLFNAKQLFAAVDAALKPAYAIDSSLAGVLFSSIHFGVVLIVVFLGIILFFIRYRPSVSFNADRFLLVLGICLVPGLVSALVIFPSPHYLAVVKVAVLVIFAFGLQLLVRRFSPYGRLSIMVLLMGGMSVSFCTPFDPPKPRSVMPTLAAIPLIPGEKTYGLIADSAKSFCIYTTPKRCRPIEILWGEYDAFSDQLARRIEMQNVRVLITGARFHPEKDPRWQRYFEQHGGEWRATKKRGEFFVFVRD